MDQGKQSSPAWSCLTHTVTSVLIRDGMTAASAVCHDVRPACARILEGASRQRSNRSIRTERSEASPLQHCI